jgi:uncharacterized PurR-regulated membrane protein YhhQ (DUF165 family)
MTEYKHVQRPDSLAISLDVEVVLGSMMLTAILVGPALGYKVVQIGGLTFSAGAFVFPWSWAIMRIVGQSYGLQAALNRWFPATVCLLFASISMAVAAHLPESAQTAPVGRWFDIYANYVSFSLLIAAPVFGLGILASWATFEGCSRLLGERLLILHYWAGLTAAQAAAALVSVPIVYSWYLHSPVAWDILWGRLMFAPIYALVMAAVSLPVAMWLRSRIPPRDRSTRLQELFHE